MSHSTAGLLVLDPAITPSTRRRAERMAAGMDASLVELEVPAGGTRQDHKVVLQGADDKLLDVLIAAAPAAAMSEPAIERMISSLIHDASITVVVLRPTRARKERVLVAVDLGSDDAQHQILQDVLLDTAPALAGETGRVRLAHAWELFGESTIASSPFLETLPPDLQQQLDEERARLDESLRALIDASQLEPGRVDTMLLHGPKVEQLTKAIADTNTTMLAIGTVGRHGLRGLLVGNTAESLLRQIACSLAVVRVPVLD